MVEPLVDLTVDPVVVKLGLVVVVLFGMDGGSWWMRVPTGMTAHSGTEWMDRTARQWRPGLGQTVVPTEAFVGGDILFFAPSFRFPDRVLSQPLPLTPPHPSHPPPCEENKAITQVAFCHPPASELPAGPNLVGTPRPTASRRSEQRGMEMTKAACSSEKLLAM